jgi:hypothetical protein
MPLLGSGCTIVGVEIDPAARPIQEHPFKGNTAFMLGNEVRRGKGASRAVRPLAEPGKH